MSEGLIQENRVVNLTSYTHCRPYRRKWQERGQVPSSPTQGGPNPEGPGEVGGITNSQSTQLPPETGESASANKKG